MAHSATQSRRDRSRAVLLARPQCLAQPPAQASRRQRPHFVDIAPAANMVYRTNNGATGRKYFPQPLCGGAAILDFDGDGAMPATATAFSEMKAGLAGDGLGFSCCAAAGDFVDNDGGNTFYRNNGNGTFTGVTAGSGLSDNDGLLDLAVADYVVWSPSDDKRCW